tara:strand:+ start:73534 stop:76401 length:2868 start_codon:yes stop_codon:yes gene_type:complete
MLIKNRLTLAVSAALGLSAGAVLPGVANAQDSEADLLIEEVIVTGSRILRSNLQSPTPITTIDSDTIEFSGQINAADILRNLPSAGVPGISSANSNFFTSGGGVNTINLRNLGEDRTLVLVNGRRYISGVAGTAAVDWNTIPTELIDRVEVITGGASAIYGSDALAGVVNVILKNDFEGLEISGSFGETIDHGDDKRQRINITMGDNFANDRGNAVVSVTYSDEGGVLARDRRETRLDDLSGIYFGEDVRDSIAPVFSSYSESGRLFVPSTGDSYVFDPTLGANGELVPYSDTYGFNRQAFRRYLVPTERYLISSNINYRINNSVEAYLETTFARTETSTELEPFPLGNEDLNIPGIHVSNPYVPAAMRDFVTNAGDEYVEFWRRTTELGERGAEAERQTFRALFGLRGDISDGWAWDAYYGEGRMQDSQRSTGQLNAPNFRNALNVVDGDGDPSTFDPVCADPAARAEGCVPINIFGKGSISQDAADYVRAPSIRDQKTEQTIAGFNITGEVFDLPAGSVAIAAGYEYRSEYAGDFPDALTQTGQNAGNQEQITEGKYSVDEIFLEIDVPLLKDLPLIDDLSAGAAYRYSDYDTVGSTDAYTARLSWQFTESLRARLQYAKAVRAPNITEQFAPGGENFAPVSDPCDGITSTTPGIVAENCRSIPAVASRIAETGVFDLQQTEIQGTGGFTGLGNENLDTETSDSFTVGLIFDHSFGEYGETTVSVDWYSIEIEDLIDVVGRQTAIDFCYTGQNFPNEFCDLVVRDTTGPAFQLGEITEVNSGYINEGELKTEGIDVQFQWSILPGDFIQGAAGQIGLNVNYSYLDKFEETKFGVTQDYAGEVGYAEHRWLASLGYRTDNLAIQWETLYIGDSKPSLTTPEFNYDVGEFVVHDIYASYQIMDNLNLHIGVDNVLDEEAPTILTGVTGNTTGWDTNASVYPVYGTKYYVGFKAAF